MAASRCGCCTEARSSWLSAPATASLYGPRLPRCRTWPHSCCACRSRSSGCVSRDRCSIRSSASSSGPLPAGFTEPCWVFRSSHTTIPVSIVPESRLRRFVGGLGLGYVHTVLTVAVGLWLTPFLLRHLGSHDYGLWLLGAQVLVYLALMDVGIVQLVPRDVAVAAGRANGDYSE